MENLLIFWTSGIFVLFCFSRVTVTKEAKTTAAKFEKLKFRVLSLRGSNTMLSLSINELFFRHRQFSFSFFLFYIRKYLRVAIQFLHSSICKRNTLQISANKIISYRFLRKCLFAGDSCLYVSVALAIDTDVSAVRPY